MRQFVGTALLLLIGVALLVAGSPAGLIPFGFGVSSIIAAFKPGASVGAPGKDAAIVLGGVILALLFLAALDSFFDDC